MNSDVLAQLLEQLYSPAIELHKKRQIQFEKNMLKYYFFPNLLNSQLGSMFKALLIRVGRMWEKRFSCFAILLLGFTTAICKQ